MLLAITFGVAVFGVVAYFERQNEIGSTDDFKDVDLANIIAFAERANAVYPACLEERDGHCYEESHPEKVSHGGDFRTHDHFSLAWICRWVSEKNMDCLA